MFLGHLGILTSGLSSHLDFSFLLGPGRDRTSAAGAGILVDFILWTYANGLKHIRDRLVESSL